VQAVDIAHVRVAARMPVGPELDGVVGIGPGIGVVRAVDIGVAAAAGQERLQGLYRPGMCGSTTADIAAHNSGGSNMSGIYS